MPRSRGGLAVSERAGDAADEDLDWLQAKADIFEASAQSPGLAAVCAKALVYLTSGDSQRAVSYLEQADRQSGLAPEFRVDLAAALLERSRSTESPEDAIRALAIVDGAVAAKPDMAEAHFDRALALERLYLRDEAIAAWRTYLSLDGRSEWAGEAGAHLAALERPVAPDEREITERIRAAAVAGDSNEVRTAVDNAPNVARAYAIERIATLWAEAVTARNAADSRLYASVLDAVGDALESLQSDRFVRDLAASVNAAAERADAVGEPPIATALTEHAAGRHLFERRDIAAAARAFTRARAAYLRAACPAGAVSADVDVAGCLIYQYRYAEAVALLERCERTAHERGYVALSGRIAWRLAVVAMSDVEIPRAMRFQQRALDAFDRSGDAASEAFLHTLMSITCDTVGANRDAWRHRFKALELESRLADPAPTVLVDSQTAAGIAELGEPAVALYFQNRAVATSERVHGVADLPYAYLVRSRIEFQLGHRDACESDLARAKSALDGLEDPSARDRTASLIAAAEAEFVRADDPSLAARLASDALAHVASTGEPYFRVEFHGLRARALEALGDDEGAASDLSLAVAEIERERKKLLDPSSRVGFFARPQAIYDELSALQAEKLGQVDLAFATSEMGRARGLLDAVAGDADGTERPGRDAVASVASLQASLASGQALVEYDVTDESLLIWVVTSDRIAFRGVPVARGELARLAGDFRSSLERAAQPDEIAAASAPLYSLLVTPVADLLGGVSRLVLVPDAELERVPFAALSNASENSYLVEDFEILQAPSASVFVKCCERAAANRAPEDVRVLVVGNPRNTSERFASLASLDNAQVEAEEVARIYPSSVLLTGARATPAAVIAAAGQCHVIHFAGHSVSDLAFPGDAAIVLASDSSASPTRGEDAVRPAELLAGGRRAPGLVVLSACRTGDGPVTEGEGVASFARGVLALGVPTVVASYWDVNDEGASRLFVAFHTRYRSERNAAAALRFAQLSMLRDGNTAWRSPSVWAAFVAIGGFTNDIADN